MSLIKCPECGKEISDKASSCPNCGYPIASLNTSNTANTITPYTEQMNVSSDQIKKRKNPFVLIVSGIVIVFIIIAAIIFGGKFQKEKKYNEALKYLTNGNYSEANTLLQDIKDYKDVDTILEQIKWETRAFECIEQLKNHLKNQESLQLYEIKFYNPDEDAEYGYALNLLANDEPIVIIHQSAQNGYGGNTTGYDLFLCSDDGTYEFLGNCDTLNIDDIDDKEERIVCSMINSVLENTNEIGDINLDRIKQILKDGNDTSVERID